MMKERQLFNQFQLDQGFDKGMSSMQKFTSKMGPKFGEMDKEIISLSKDIDKLPLNNRIHGAFCDVSMDYDLEPRRTRPLRRPDNYEVLSEE